MQTSVEWLIEEIENLITIDTFPKWQTIKEEAKEMEKGQHADTWDQSMKNYEERGMVFARAWSDFDDYFQTKFQTK